MSARTYFQATSSPKRASIPFQNRNWVLHSLKPASATLSSMVEAKRSSLRLQKQMQQIGQNANTGCRRIICSAGKYGSDSSLPWRRDLASFKPTISCSIEQLRFNSSSSSQINPTSIDEQSPVTNDSCQPCPPLPIQFLDAYDSRKFDPLTHQRNDVLFDPINGKPLPLSSSSNEAELFVWSYGASSGSWSLSRKKKSSHEDKHDDKPELSSCNYSNDWVCSQIERWRADPDDFDCQWKASNNDANTGVSKNSQSNENDAAEESDPIKRVLWSNWTESMVRDPADSPILFQYDSLVRSNDDSNVKQQKPPSKDVEESRLLKTLYQYGIALITGTPTYTDTLSLAVLNKTVLSSPADGVTQDKKESAESAILHLASIIGYHPLRTLYGSGVWSTSSSSSFYQNRNKNDVSASTADSSYGSSSLPLHTDMTYISNPPGVQVFLMVQPATSNASVTSSSTSGDEENKFISKGQSVFLDGFAAANQLLKENPKAFHVLATTQRRYRCVDKEEGWNLEACGPIIDSTPRWQKYGDLKSEKMAKFEWSYEWGPVKSIRHNDLDRLPDLPPYPSLDEMMVNDFQNDPFYNELREAHEAWNEILGRDSMRLVIDLEPGDCVLVANQRCLHGRYSFETSAFPRVVMGCYVGMDELSSKWRSKGFRVL